MDSISDELLALKLFAFFLSKAILLNPAELVGITENRPNFIDDYKFRKLKWFTDDDLIYMSSLFTNDSFERPSLEGFWGTGVSKDEDGNYLICVYGTKSVLERLERGLQHVELKSKYPIKACVRNNLRAASKIPKPLSTKCRGGSCIKAHGGSYVGTLGGWLKLEFPYGVPIGITNNHVVTECEKYKCGHDVVMEPDWFIGQIADRVKLKIYDPTNLSTANLVDFAWISPANASIVDFRLGCSETEPIGEIDFSLNFHHGRTKVFLCHSDSKLLSGEILSLPMDLRYTFDSNEYQFIDLVEINIGKRGNSGSLVIDNDFNIGGIFFATADGKEEGESYGYVNHWHYVKQESGLSFIY